MKIAVITLHAIKNYGSVLQTLATQIIFERLGCEVTVINFLREDSLDKNVYKRWTNGDNQLKKIAKSIALFPTAQRWKHVFWGFLNDNIHLTPRIYLSEDELIEDLPEADVYCTGSDQVWNSGWNNGFLPEFFLSFVPDDKKRISLSASIGKDCLEDWEKELTKQYLNKYYAISVREDTAVTILRDLGINNVVHTLDPTLLLEKEYWLSIARKRKVSGDYVLIYQLNRNAKFDAFAVEFAKRKKCKLVRLCTRYDQIRLPGKHILIPNVEDFISLMANASYVITDSFHATAFSLNLNREVICIYPDKFSSRLASILRDTNLESRHLKDYTQFDIADNEIDFNIINQYFQKEREKANDYLINALELKGE